MELTAEQKTIADQTREEFGDVLVAATPRGDVFIARPASSLEAARYQDKLASVASSQKKKTSDNTLRTAQQMLTRAVLRYPSTDEGKTELLEKYPFLHVKIADRCVEMSGGDFDELGND